MAVDYRDKMTYLSCDSLSRLILRNMIQYSGNNLDIVQAARAPPALGSALPGLADGAKAASSQLAPRYGDVLQVEVLPALRSPWLAQQDSSALLLAAGEKGPAILTNPCRELQPGLAHFCSLMPSSADTNLGPALPPQAAHISCLHWSTTSGRVSVLAAWHL